LEREDGIMAKINILVADNIAAEGVNMLKDSGQFVVDVKTGLPENEITKIIKKYDGLLVRSQTKVTKKIIDAADKLKIIGRAGVGVDNVDIPAATRKGIVVMNVPGGNTISAAEHTLGMILSLSRNIPQANQSLRNMKWERKKFIGTELLGKTLGVIGFGRIGREVAKRAKSFGMDVIAHDPFISHEYASDLGIKLVSLEEIMKKSDFISLHAPVNPKTQNIINKETLKLVKDGTRIINCARGELIDDEALVEAIKSGKVKGAALDVFSKEPPFDSKVLGLDNIVVTPHLGASTEEAQVNVATEIAKQVTKYFVDGIIQNAVNLPMVSSEVLDRIRPYMELAERIGSFQGQLVNGGISQINIQYSGEIINYDIKLLTLSLLKGLLSRILQREINLVNAPFIAKERGIRIKESSVSRIKDYANLVLSEIKTEDGKNLIGGTLFRENDLRIIRIDNFYLDVVAQGNILICYHLDTPGIIGKIGTILGENKINIAAMDVGRTTLGGNAITISNVDSSVPEKVLKRIKSLPQITDVQVVSL